jgi:hypothetical protein
VVEEVESEIELVERELAKKRGGAGSWLWLETSCTRISSLGLRLLYLRKSRDSSPKVQRRGRSSKRLKAAYSASGLKWWRLLC